LAYRAYVILHGFNALPARLILCGLRTRFYADFALDSIYKFRIPLLRGLTLGPAGRNVTSKHLRSKVIPFIPRLGVSNWLDAFLLTGRLQISAMRAFENSILYANQKRNGRSHWLEFMKNLASIYMRSRQSTRPSSTS